MTNLVDNIDNRLNLLTGTRWLAVLPTKALNPDQSSESTYFNLTDYTINPLSLATVNADWLGYTVEMPSPFVRNDNKTFTFNYVMDSNMHQYIMLYNWFSKMCREEGSGFPDYTNEVVKSFMFPIRVLILSEFKKPVLEVIYEDCWIQELGRVEFNYQGNAEVVKSSFTIKYQRMYFNTDMTSWSTL